MLKKLFKYFIAKHSAKEKKLDKADADSAKKIFFAVFSRYGDGIISFKVIREFIGLYPDKQYLLFTTSQLVPYAREILGENVEFVGVNKRNPFSLVPSLLKLKNFDADLGFNPWSHGDDAEFFVSFAKKYSIFKRFRQWDKTYNVYDRVREYLSIAVKSDKIVHGNFDVSEAGKIVIAPLSTDVKKNLSKKDLLQLITWIKLKNPNAKITIAAPSGFDDKEFVGINFFVFGKSMKKSNDFLFLIKNCDLFIGVDSGPLHLALCLGKKCIGIFGSNAPETIIDNGFSMISYRHPLLSGIFCFVRNCDNAECIHAVFDGNIHEFECLLVEKVTLEEVVCPLVKSKE
jgi:ADP-heptose:LPS heptosyltransferase